jgi:hypothetical protein
MKNRKICIFHRDEANSQETMRQLYKSVCNPVPTCAAGTTKATEIHRKERSRCAGLGSGGFLELVNLNSISRKKKRQRIAFQAGRTI